MGPLGTTVGQRPSRARVLYIGGLGRSGSTLLDRMLGQVPGFFSAGEVRDLWQRGLVENRLCGCGTPFRECPFWLEVGDRAFGGWHTVDVPAVIALARRVDRHSVIPLLIAPRAWPPFARSLGALGQVLSPLYRAIQEVSDARVVIDSSKAPSSAFVLRRVPTIDLEAIHLIRDSRGVAYSWAKRIVRPDTPGQVTLMHRYPAYRVGARWITRNALMELLGRLGVTTVRMRYEALVRSPAGEITAALRGLREPFDPDDLAFISDGHVRLGPNHTVMGNPMRMDQGRIALRIDEEWRTAMDRKRNGMVTALTRPFLRRYGYDP